MLLFRGPKQETGRDFKRRWAEEFDENERKNERKKDERGHCSEITAKMKQEIINK